MNQSEVVSGKPVAVIGAGVSGLVAAKRLAAEGFQVHIIERRSQAGGLWNFSPDPNAPFASAVYGDLQTNFPRQLMELQDYPWTNQPLFMQHNLVQQYLAGYAKDIQQKCNSRVRFHFDTEVVRLFHESYAGGHWELTWKSVLTGASTTSRYLYVVIAAGVFDEPFIPSYEGLPAWREKWNGSVSHAKSFRDPTNFRGKNVLIVGYQASGFDIAWKIGASVSKLWISSTRQPADGLPPNAISVPRVVRFFPLYRSVTFTDGRTIWDVDHVVFCTGYQFHQPFIKKNSDTDEPLFPSGPIIENLYEHIIYIDQPTLAFLGTVRDAVPTFLIVQAQAAFISRFFSDQLRSLRPRKEDPQHRLPYPVFVDYLLRLESFCEQADGSRPLNETHGNNPVFRWTLELDLVRTRRRGIRDAFMSLYKTMTGIWCTSDIIHELHGNFLNMSPCNIQALVPFLVLYYGYRDDYAANQILPFQGWQCGFGQIIGKSIIDWCSVLPHTLQQESHDVLRRGSVKLCYLFLDRWTTFAKGLENREMVLENGKILLWRSDFEMLAPFYGLLQSPPPPEQRPGGPRRKQGLGFGNVSSMNTVPPPIEDGESRGRNRFSSCKITPTK